MIPMDDPCSAANGATNIGVASLTSAARSSLSRERSIENVTATINVGNCNRHSVYVG